MPWPTMPEIIVYKDTNFQGDSWLTSLPPGWGWNYVGDNWNDSISSVIILSGKWTFFENGGFDQSANFRTVGPGWYTFVHKIHSLAVACKTTRYLRSCVLIGMIVPLLRAS